GWHSQEPPIAVSLDLRDEEHSLMLAIRRLADDPRLRAALAGAAYEWWRTHATVPQAVDAWARLLEETVTLPPPTVAERADGTQTAREILREFGLSVDFLEA